MFETSYDLWSWDLLPKLYIAEKQEICMYLSDANLNSDAFETETNATSTRCSVLWKAWKWNNSMWSISGQKQYSNFLYSLLALNYILYLCYFPVQICVFTTAQNKCSHKTRLITFLELLLIIVFSYVWRNLSVPFDVHTILYLPEKKGNSVYVSSDHVHLRLAPNEKF